MIISIYNRYFCRIGILRKATFCQMVDKLREVGTFNVKSAINRDALMLLDKTETFYLEFNDQKNVHPLLGVVRKVEKDADSDEEEIEISGDMCSFIFANRVVAQTQNYSGTADQIIKAVIEKNITASPSTSTKINPRYIDITVVAEEKKNNVVLDKIQVQKTGDDILSVLSDLCEQYQMGFDFYPVIDTLHTDEHLGNTYPQTNISKWKLDILFGKDRTRQNTFKNKPIIFSQDFGNLTRATYQLENTDYKNIAYVAGEGEGTERKVQETVKEGIDQNGIENIGFGRLESYVDARDLQKETEDKTLTDEEYSAALEQRGQEKLSECKIVDSYDATVIMLNSKGEERYKYGKDFYKGDFIELRDIQLGLTAVSQITAVTRTWQKGKSDIYDIQFGNPKILAYDKLKKKGVI